MTLLAMAAVALACGLAAALWEQRHEARQRSAARVAALAAAIDAPAMTFDGPLADAESRRSGDDDTELKARNHVPLERRRWMIAAGAVPLVLVVAALLVTRGPRASAPPALHQPESLELLDLRYDRTGDLLTITGTVRVRGRDAAPVTAIVTGRDATGRVVASAHAPLDDAGLDIGGESSFRVSVAGQDVRRYQIRFETPLGPLVHLDRRPQRQATAATP